MQLSDQTAPANHGAHAQKNDDFLLQVKNLKDAEQGAFAAIEAKRKEAMQIEAAAREQSVEILAKAQEKSVEAKNEILARGREQTDKEVNGILHDAKKRADKIRANELSEKEAAALTQSMF